MANRVQWKSNGRYKMKADYSLEVESQIGQVMGFQDPGQVTGKLLQLNLRPNVLVFPTWPD